jgi:murein DD-endopeptidase MepM/ murein hydrolase activator NlpD
MSEFKQLAKKYLAFLISVFFVCLNKVNVFCQKVIPVIFSNVVSFLKGCPRVFAAILTAVLIFSCTVTVVLATGATTACAVVLDGETIAMVKDSSILAEAQNFAVNKVNNPNCSSHLIKPNLTQTIAGEKILMSSTELSDCIIKHSGDIVLANVLKVEDKIVATGNSYDEINASLQAILLGYKQSNGAENVEFSNDYEIVESYILKTDLEKLPNITNYLKSSANALLVETVSTVVVVEDVPFKTIETESDDLLVGSKKTTKAGVKGKKEITYKVYSLKGAETKRVVESEKSLSEPVSQEVIVGTKKSVSTNQNSATMCWPVERVEKSYVSSYMGDGRGHKGMDIVAPAKTPIYASESGTVTFAGWDSSGYGYKILIKHSNGYETLYAHCSKLYVKKGDVVVKGENIAAVGTTGRSTGNHLHFEVHQNGSIKNPAKFIGRK